MPTPTPSPTPSPAPSFACDYYASPTGSSSGSGTNTSPWSLQAGLNKTTLVRNGKTLCLKGGTYRGKFQSTLNGGGIVRSAPGEWAILDGFVGTTLVGAISSSQTSFTVADASGLLSAGGSDELNIDGEIIKFCSKSGNTLTGCARGASGSIGGASAHAGGAAVLQAGGQLNISGANTIYRDFEVTHSYPARTEPQTSGTARGNGINVYGDGNSIINVVIHDCLQGVFTSSASSNTLIYGVLAYNVGVVGETGEALGHGFYLENVSGYSRLYESISLNAFNLGMQGFGQTGPYVGGDIQGSVFSGAGTPVGEVHYNMIYGPANQVSPTATVNESHFAHQPGAGYSVNFGYGAGITNGTFTNNYFYGASVAFEAQAVTNLTFTGNKFYSPGAGDVYTIVRVPGFTWNGNTYYNAGTQSRFGRAGIGTYSFTNWKPQFNYDASSTAVSSAMPNTAIVRPNSYQRGRANVIIYASSSTTSINVNLSAIGLANGQGYTIKNASDWNGPNVATGTFNSSNPVISLPLNANARSVATPVGRTFTPATTCPNFCVMVVVPN